jgi:hypothetical protein
MHIRAIRELRGQKIRRWDPAVGPGPAFGPGQAFAVRTADAQRSVGKLALASTNGDCPDPSDSRLVALPTAHLLGTHGMPDCQIEAITGLENSFAENRPRAHIHMATGAGKTYTACAFTYRLIKYAGARRVLFLVDWNGQKTSGLAIYLS